MAVNMFCRACGTRLDADARFCDTCGSPTGTPALAKGKVPLEGIQPPAESRPAAANRRWWVFGASAVLVAALGYVIASPWIKLQQIKTLINDRNVVSLVDAVGRQGIRQSAVQTVEETLRRIREEDASAGLPPNQFLQSLPKDIGTELTKGIDKVLSPTSLNELQARLSAQPEDVFGGLVDKNKNKKKEAEADIRRVMEQAKVSSGYAGVNRFKVEISHPDLGSTVIHFTRSNVVDWQLEQVDGSEMISLLLREFGVAATPQQLVDVAWKKENYVVASKWLERLVAKGSDVAMLRLGVLQLEAPQGIEPQVVQGLANLERAASLGNARAAIILGFVHLDGFKVTASSEPALKWFRRAFELTSDIVLADFISSLYGNLGDVPQALEWSRLAEKAPPRYFDANGRLIVGKRLDEISKSASARRSAARNELEGMLAGNKSSIGEGWVAALLELDGDIGALRGVAESVVVDKLGSPTSRTHGNAFRSILRYEQRFPYLLIELGFSSGRYQDSIQYIVVDASVRYPGPAKLLLSKLNNNFSSYAAVNSSEIFSHGCLISEGDLLNYTRRVGHYLSVPRMKKERRGRHIVSMCGSEVRAIEINFN